MGKSKSVAKMEPAKESSDDPPKRILANLGKVGNQYAWLDKVKVDWGGRIEDTFRVGMPNGVFNLPILDNGNVLLVHQYRVLGRGWIYEIPGGIIDQTESEEVAAIRELEEETGYRAQQVEKLCSYHPFATSLVEFHIYVARKLTKTQQHLDSGEAELTPHEVTPTQLYEMVLDGTITDGKTILATLVAKERGFLKINPKELKKGHPF
jgi:ADP-ribose pyrophosphatase